MSRQARPGVALRPATPADAAWLAEWLPAVAASVGHDPIDPPSWLSSRAARRVRIIVRDGADVGVLAYRPHAPARGSATFELVATPPQFARRGSGMAAAALVEDELRAARIHTAYAPAPAAHGIAVYFWIRLGYRPLLRAQWPCDRPGIAWLMRDL